VAVPVGMRVERTLMHEASPDGGPYRHAPRTRNALVLTWEPGGMPRGVLVTTAGGVIAIVAAAIGNAPLATIFAVQAVAYIFTRRRGGFRITVTPEVIRVDRPDGAGSTTLQVPVGQVADVELRVVELAVGSQCCLYAASREGERILLCETKDAEHARFVRAAIKDYLSRADG